MYLAIAFACLQFQKNSSFCKQLKRTLVAQAQYQNDVTRFKSPEKSLGSMTDFSDLSPAPFNKDFCSESVGKKMRNNVLKTLRI